MEGIFLGRIERFRVRVGSFLFFREVSVFMFAVVLECELCCFWF